MTRLTLTGWEKGEHPPCATGRAQAPGAADVASLYRKRGGGRGNNGGPRTSGVRARNPEFGFLPSPPRTGERGAGGAFTPVSIRAPHLRAQARGAGNAAAGVVPDGLGMSLTRFGKGR